ncbi:type II secretion system major pseudopilin GspG [Duganella sp. HH105]|uniref:type II secretion system major pseudopilin GspG n=1 Tax=Duganella sp. HH105 TaxID=1781067 RepID=UPI00143AC46D|nr:type II secretion system major pseudopilin GspG [Duganella sp. HH105]
MIKTLILILISGCVLVACAKTDEIVFGPDPVGQISATSEKFTSMPEKDRKLLFAYIAYQMRLAPDSIVGRRAADVLNDARVWETKRDDAAKVQAAQTDLLIISQALRLYKLDIGSFPTQQEGLVALIERPSTTKAHVKWNDGGYLVKVPMDPWNTAYQYTSSMDGRTSTIASLGSDKKIGGAGTAADIVVEVR